MWFHNKFIALLVGGGGGGELHFNETPTFTGVDAHTDGVLQNRPRVVRSGGLGIKPITSVGNCSTLQSTAGIAWDLDISASLI